jgi:type IV pilus assembly protein PilM
VRAAELSFGRNGATLERFAQVALPPGAVRDGEVADVQTVASAIRTLWSTGKFSTKKVVLGVANQRVIVRQVDLPWLPLNELRDSLPFHVQDFIPMPIDQAILDFHPIEEYVNSNRARMLRVLLVAASRDMVTNAIEAARLGGVTVQQVDLTPFAVVRSIGSVDTVGATPGMHSEAEALIDVGSKVTNIVVHQNGVPRFVRILLMGGDNLTEAVADRMGVPWDQAETIKQQLGLSAVVGAAPVDHPGAQVLEHSGATLIEEIRGSLDYYLAQPSASSLRRVVVSGGAARLGGFLNRLSLATRLPVDPALPLSALRMGKTGLSDEQLNFVEPLVTVPVGLAMGVAS